MTDQLAMLTENAEAPPRWPCPTCRGNKQMIRILYPSEVIPDGPLTTICPCRGCGATGWVGFDPEDRSTIPY